DLMYKGGMGWMRYSISDTAEYGDYSRGPRVIGPEVKARMKEILREIQTGQFASEWLQENLAGRARFLTEREKESNHQIERVGKELRAMMPWLKDSK
ncbi:MAG: ketol-acid reductoisomerase, partial [Chloroflexi bacterium]|nr:ketol-acid reductoisomerase [Chloroflexota bacterium]